jgi:hypothetical protein
MSATRFASVTRELHEAAAGAAWIQWQALGAQAAAPRAPRAIVDPEALLLLSLWLADEEPRLRDFLSGFAQLGSRLLSVQRLKRAMILYPEDAEARVAPFASHIASHGKDARWRTLAVAKPPRPGRPGKVGPASARFGEPGSLMLRLRAGIGVDVRTDVLSYLIGRGDAWSDVREIAGAILYAKYSVRSACEALADAGLIVTRAERPVSYSAAPGRWLGLLGLDEPPPWRPWVHVFAYVVRLLEWLRGPGRRQMSAALAASLAREFVVEHGAVLAELRLDIPDERALRDEAYLPAFERMVSALAEWLVESA